MRTGSCRHCGYAPVAKNAPFCPECGGAHPHPTASRWGSFFVVLGFAVVMLVVLLALIPRTKPRPHFRAFIEGQYVTAAATKRLPNYFGAGAATNGPAAL